MENPRASKAVVEAIEELLSRAPVEDPLGILHAASVHGALPLHLTNDLGGVFALRPNGEVIECRISSNSVVRVLEDRDVTRINLLVLSIADHPDLGEFLPDRSEGDEDCVKCEGSGRRTVKPGVQVGLCGVCGGIGWVAGADRSGRAAPP